MSPAEIRDRLRDAAAAAFARDTLGLAVAKQWLETLTGRDLLRVDGFAAPSPSRRRRKFSGTPAPELRFCRELIPDLRHAGRKSPSRAGLWQHSGSGDGPGNGRIEPVTLDFLRTLCGLGGVIPHLTCGNAPIHTLKRNSTTSPSCMT